MWKSLVILCAVALTSCAGPEIPDTPGNSVVRAYSAINEQDSLAYMSSLSREKREVYEAIPAALQSMLNEWKGQRADVKVLSVHHNDTMATIVYNLKVEGGHPAEQDSLLAHAYLEEDGWKLGY